MDKLWTDVLAEVEVEVSKPIFHTFFKGTRLASLTEGVATIAAPTFMISEYIEKRYYSLLKKALDKKTGQNVSLVFVAQAKEGREHTQKKDSLGPLFTRPVAKTTRPARIRPDYTFETFAVSESNQLAYTAANTIAASLGAKYNPLYLFGTVGVGKTHLMHAVANTVVDENPDAKVIYLTTEEFTNEVVEAIRDKNTFQVRKKFRHVDLLLLDDVQFLSGKERVQEELFHTFNTLIDRGSQVIFSSDRPPSEIKKIEARLASRFEGGLTIDIQSPDFELRTAILLIKSAKYSLDLTVDMAKIIAERVVDSRALEGFLLKLSSTSLAKNQPIDISLIETILGKPKEKSSIIHPDTIIDTVCAFYNVRATQVRGAKRDALLVRPRHMCMYLLKKETRLTLVEIGNLLGGRDHTTIMHGVDKMRELLLTTPRVSEEIVFIKRKLREQEE